MAGGELLIENALPIRTWSVGLVPAVDHVPCGCPGYRSVWPLLVTTFTLNRSKGRGAGPAVTSPIELNALP